MTPPTSIAVHPTGAGGVTRTQSPRPAIAAAAWGAAGFVVAFLGSWVPSLWTDEAASITAATRSLPELWTTAQRIDAVHSAYYLILHGWTSLFGISATSLRLPSALAVGLATGGVYLLGRRLVGSPAAMWSAALFMLLPRVTWMGTEARSWAFTTAAAVWLTLILVALLQPQSRSWSSARRVVGWITYGLLAALAILLNIYLVFLLAAHAIVQLVWWRRIAPSARWAWLVAAGGGAAAASPIVLLASGQSGQLGGERFGLTRLLRSVVFNQYALGETPSVDGTDLSSGVRGLFVDGGWRAASLVLGAMLVGLCVVAVVTAWRSGGTDQGEIRGQARSVLLWTAPWILVPTVVLGAYSVVAEPLYGPRYLSFTSPALALLAGWGLSRVRPRWLQISAAALALLAIVPIYVSQRQTTAKSGADWSEVASVLSDGARPGDAVYFAPRYPVEGDRYGQSTRGIAIAYPDAFAGLRDLTLRVPGPEDGTLTGQSVLLSDPDVEWTDVDRVWSIRRNGDPAGTADGDAAQFAREGFTKRSSWVGPLDTVILYSR